MIRHFLISATCILFSRLCYLAAVAMEYPWRSFFSLGSFVLCAGGIGWCAVKLIDWWGEEAPVSHPQNRRKWSRMSYREAKVRLRLIELFDGDARLARRQVRILMERYPGKPEQWCWERAIVDIEGDRAA
jgi:hypothetical protein